MKGRQKGRKTSSDKSCGRVEVVVLSLSFVPFHHHHVLHEDVEVDIEMDCFSG